MFSRTLAFVATLAWVVLLHAATLTVDLNGGADYTSIQAAIDAAADSDTVLVKPGEYVITEPIDFNRLHDPENPASPPVKNIVVRSEGGPEVTTIRMAETPPNSNNAWVLVFENGETNGSALDGFTISGGQGPWGYGGGVLCTNSSSPTLTNCTISGNSAAIGGGVYCRNSSPTLTNCTISGNTGDYGGGGVYCVESSSPELQSCIVWGNLGGSVSMEATSHPIITYSCIEGEQVWPGEGNINLDPVFCGWEGELDVWVDPSWAATGDGSEGNPFSDPRQATMESSFSLALVVNSPCLGTGKDGSDMGADNGRCDVQKERSRIVHLAAGTYQAGDFNLAHRVSLLGSGEDRTVIEGTLNGPRSGSSLSNLMVTKGLRGGIVIPSGEGPEISDCTIVGNNSCGRASGVYCSPRSSPRLVHCTIAQNTSVLCQGHVPAVVCESDSSPILTDCTISWNQFSGVYCWDSSPILTDCTISRNAFSGVYCQDSSPILTNCTISGNSSAGVYAQNSSPTLASCTISGNCYTGVACWCNSSPTLTNCTISGNSGNSGGGVYCSGSSPILTNCTISGNSARRSGGVHCGEGSSPTLTNCTISGNSALDVSGVYCSDSSPTLTNCIVWGNAEGPFAISGEGAAPDVTFSCLETREVWPGQGNINSNPLFCGYAGPAETFVDAASPEGGDGTTARPFRDLAAALTFRLSLEEGSPCIGAGEHGTNMGADQGTCEAGGPSERVVHVARGRYSMEGLSLSQGASLFGAGANETVLQGTVRGLRTGATLSAIAVTGGKSGGVVVAGESPTLTSCRISGNLGSGVYCLDSSPFLTNCTISGNGYTNSCIGGGMYCGEGSSPTLSNCTISGNRARWWDGSGGVYCEEGSFPTLTNCIVWGNDPESVCGDLFECLFEDPLFVHPGEWVDCGSPDDPFCIAYPWSPDSGEPSGWKSWVFDYHLGPGSPAIDAGTTEDAPATDIEGNGRPCGAGVDIGAYEFGDCLPGRFERGDANDSGAIDIADAIFTLSYLFAMGKVPDCLDAADANDSGAVDIADAIAILSHLFAHTGPLPEPFGECGIDPTVDELDCVNFGPCQ